MMVTKQKSDGASRTWAARYPQRCAAWVLAAILGLVPLSGEAQVTVVSEPVRERSVLPGDSYADVIRVRNTADVAVEVRIYQMGYLFYADGRVLHMPPDSQPRSNAGWFEGLPSGLVIPAGEEAEVNYTVRVPSDGAAGTYWSTVMIEPAMGRPGAVEPSPGIRTVLRFGVQVATHVRGELTHRLALEDARVVAGDAGDGAQLEFALVNDGAVGYRPNVSVEIFDGRGAPVGSLEAQRGLIYPGTSALQRFSLADLPPGAYQALVVVDTGGVELFGAQFELTLDGT